MTVAVVLFVKNDARGILSWLGWYKAIGVDSIILIDDTSSDATATLAEDASHEFDIRIIRLPPSIGPHGERQKQAYIDAIEYFRNDFEWMGFLDADEYLKINNFETIKEFLKKFENNVSQVCINWCNYGSSGYLERPLSLPFSAYVHHMHVNEAINRHVKSFIRPALWAGNWSNVHSFNMVSGRTVNTNGEDIVWSETTGIISDIPMWDHAKIMHYQCGSMQDFIERSRRRLDIKITNQQWMVYDKNDIYDPSPREKTLEIRNWIGKVLQWTVRRLGVDLEVMELPTTFKVISSHEEKNDTQKDLFKNLELFSVKTTFGDFLTVNDNGLVQSTASTEFNSRTNTLFGFKIININKIILFTGKSVCMPYILDDPRITPWLSFDILSFSESDKIALRHPNTQYFLSAEPQTLGGRIQANRTTVNFWEEFSLHKLDINGMNFSDCIYDVLLDIDTKIGSRFSMDDLRMNRLPNSSMGALILCAIIALIEGDDKVIVKHRLKEASDFLM